MSSGIAHKHLYSITADMSKECYKVIVKKNGKYSTVSHPTEIDDESIAGIKPWRAKSAEMVRSCFYNGISRWISAGFIHTFSNINDAIEKRDKLVKNGMDAHIFKCEIPINTEYYDCEMNTYMSKEIMFISEISI